MLEYFLYVVGYFIVLGAVRAIFNIVNRIVVIPLIVSFCDIEYDTFFKVFVWKKTWQRNLFLALTIIAVIASLVVSFFVTKEIGAWIKGV
ncbi:hypothetical protein [Campylobacter curvus]|uniref:hypothetical protein n=1 Tax=Campylobacter curvus TaxID=200 RepID=UPI0005A171AF|nr:hypothetical protein [Campylobacter curvus]